MLKPRPAPPDLTGHHCASPGCRAFGPFGFGPSSAAHRWYCRRHVEQGRAWWRDFQRGEGAVPAVLPRQGGLF